MAKKDKKSSEKNHHAGKKIFKTIFITCLLVLAVAILYIATIIVSASFEDINVDSYVLNQSSQIYFYDVKTGNNVSLEKIYSKENRVWVSYMDMPQHIKDAAVAIEDERFFKHNGVDIKRTLGATVTYFIDRDRGYGGSTITQQVIKNITGHDERSVSRKIKEMWNSFRLERKMSKEQILELYLNTIYLSQGCNGVGAAANMYFDKDVSELSVAESAAIIGITQYPTKYDPFLNPKNNKAKQETILYKMLELGYLDDNEYNKAVNEELNFATSNFNLNGTFNSYFVDQVIIDVATELAAKKSYNYDAALKLIHTGGFKIYSTIDPAIQKAIESVYENTANFPEGSQSAIVIIDPYTGEVKGMSGGVGKKTGDFVLNRATMSKRPPGSSIKPVAVYAPALEYGIITPNTVYEDKKVTYGSWSPSNFYSGYAGKMSIATAVKRSTNTVAVQVLEDLGIEKSFDFMKNRLGFTTLVSSRTANGKVYSDKSLASLALGGLTDGVTPYEMAAAYSSFPNNGGYIKPHTFTKVVDKNGKIILENNTQENVAMSKKTANQITQLLMGVTSAGGTGASANVSGFPVAGKTGTTDNVYDKWFVGYTPYYVGAVWFGYDTAKTIPSAYTNTAINIWNKVMAPIHSTLPSKNFEGVSSTIEIEVCSVSGKLSGEFCVDADGNKTVETKRFTYSSIPESTCTQEDHNVTTEETEDENGNNIDVAPPDVLPPDIMSDPVNTDTSSSVSKN